MCGRLAADVTNKYNLQIDGKEIEGLYCAKCAQRLPKDYSPTSCRLLLLWWAGMAHGRPLQLFLEGVGNETMPESMNSGHLKHIDLSARNLSPDAPSAAGKSGGKGETESEMTATRIKATGKQAIEIWAAVTRETSLHCQMSREAVWQLIGQ